MDAIGNFLVCFLVCFLFIRIICCLLDVVCMYVFMWHFRPYVRRCSTSEQDTNSHPIHRPPQPLQHSTLLPPFPHPIHTYIHNLSHPRSLSPTPPVLLSSSHLPTPNPHNHLNAPLTNHPPTKYSHRSNHAPPDMASLHPLTATPRCAHGEPSVKRCSARGSNEGAALYVYVFGCEKLCMHVCMYVCENFFSRGNLA